jgi:hypothetical protein
MFGVLAALDGLSAVQPGGAIRADGAQYEGNGYRETAGRYFSIFLIFLIRKMSLMTELENQKNDRTRKSKEQSAMFIQSL